MAIRSTSLGSITAGRFLNQQARVQGVCMDDASNRYSVIASVKNAFDEMGYGSSTGGTPTPIGVRRTVSLTYPRTYGMELQYRF